MASFQKRGKTWQYTISYKINGKQKPIRKGGFLTKKEAQVAATEAEILLKKRVMPNQKHVFLDYYKEWYKIYKEPFIKENTKKGYTLAENFIEVFFPNECIQDITKKQFQNAINIYGKNKKKDTIKLIIAKIKGCVKEAVDNDIIYKDFTQINLNKDIPLEIKKIFLENKEAKKLLHFLYNNLAENPIHYLIILIALSTGMRFSEIIGLTKSNIDLSNQIISVKQTWLAINHKKIGFSTPKNSASIRDIKIDLKLTGALTQFIENVPKNENDLVFFIPTKMHTPTNASINSTLKKVCSKLNITQISFHGLRHTHASMLISQNISIYYISERLGHKDTNITLSVYSHLLKDLRKKEEDKTTQFLTKL